MLNSFHYSIQSLFFFHSLISTKKRILGIAFSDESVIWMRRLLEWHFRKKSYSVVVQRCSGTDSIPEEFPTLAVLFVCVDDTQRGHPIQKLQEALLSKAGCQGGKKIHFNLVSKIAKSFFFF